MTGGLRPFDRHWWGEGEVKVYRDVFLSVHEDLEFMTRIRSVSRHLTHIFDRDKNFLNEF